MDSTNEIKKICNFFPKTLEFEEFPMNFEEMHINHLNDDCYREIFQYFTIAERLSAGLVCKKWNSIITDSWIDVKTFYINKEFIKKCEEILPNGKNYLDIISSVIKNCGMYLDTLYLKIELDDSEILIFLEAATKYCKNLINFEINLRKVKFLDILEGLNPLFQNNLKLNNLIFSYAKIKNDFYLKTNTNIEAITFNNCEINSKVLCKFFLEQKNLKKINFFDIADFLNATHIINSLIASNNLNLSEIYLGKNIYYPTTVLLQLLKKQNKLTKFCTISIDFAFDDNFTSSLLNAHKNNLESIGFQVRYLNENLINCLINCTNLKVVNLKLYNYSLTEKGEQYFAKFKNLEYLKLSAGIKDVIIDDIFWSVTSCRTLKHLDISGFVFSDDFLDSGLNSIYYNIPNLISLNVSDTNVTNAQLFDLIERAISLKELKVEKCLRISEDLFEIAGEIKVKRFDKHELTIYCENSSVNLKELDKIPNLIIIK